jgi:5-methylcytosine-specific restriction protein A
MVDLLRASHIKPWRDANKQERLDPYNGLLLSPGCDAAFDQGYISFDTAGNLLFSSRLTSDRRAQLGIPAKAKLAKVNSVQASFLDYHRSEIFRA